MKLMNKLMLSCKKATELIEKRSFVNLSFAEKVQLKMHVGVCSACRSYEKQSQVIDQSLKHISTSKKPKDLKLSEENKKHIINTLEEK